MTTASNTLHQRIVEHIRHNGPITFAEYMHKALYEPDYGYYVSGPARIGWEGDYYTSSDVSALFAHCVGHQLHQMWEQLHHPYPFIVLEEGAGSGKLAHAILQWARDHAPEGLAEALTYYTIDIHAGQNAITLQEYATRRTLSEAPSQVSLKTIEPAVILSNELVDAFPVHLVEKHNGRLYEIFVNEKDGQLYEMLDQPENNSIIYYFDDNKVDWHSFPDGWRAEVNLDAIYWMERNATLLMGTHQRVKRRGFIITIDYGDKASKLYTPERLRGTLACYHQHRFNEQPLIAPGEQDITAHVNFSALIEAGRRQGLRLQTFTTQQQWLINLQIYEQLERIRTRDFAIIDTNRASDEGQIALLKWYDLRQRVMALTDPAGMGNFKVLIMKR